jgi:hypothetical protein
MRSSHLARSSFPELGHNTKPYYTVYTQASYNHFHLALQVLTHSMHKASTIIHTYHIRLYFLYNIPDIKCMQNRNKMREMAE